MKIDIEIYFDQDKGEILFKVNTPLGFCINSNLHQALNGADVEPEAWDACFEKVAKACPGNIEISINI